MPSRSGSGCWVLADSPVNVGRRLVGMTFTGRDVVIVEAVRPPIGRGHREKGYYKDTHPNKLLGKCYSEVIERAGIDAAAGEGVILGWGVQYGQQVVHVGRNA